MSEKFDREAIINELRDGALKDPHTGWLSDLARRDLTWDGQDEIIVIGAWRGSVDVGHLAGIVESIISKHTEERTARLEQAEENLESALEANKRWAHRSSRERSELFKAEQAVARVRAMSEEMGEGKAFGILTRGREDEYPISYFIEMLEEALDGEPNE